MTSFYVCMCVNNTGTCVYVYVYEIFMLLTLPVSY